MVNDGRQIKRKDYYNDAGPGTFLWLAFICHRYKCDLNFVFDDYSYGFVAVRATRGEWGLGIENGIFEDDPRAMWAIAYVVIHSCFPEVVCCQPDVGSRSDWQ